MLAQPQPALTHDSLVGADLQMEASIASGFMRNSSSRIMRACSALQYAFRLPSTSSNDVCCTHVDTDAKHARCLSIATKHTCSIPWLAHHAGNFNSNVHHDHRGSTSMNVMKSIDSMRESPVFWGVEFEMVATTFFCQDTSDVIGKGGWARLWQDVEGGRLLGHAGKKMSSIADTSKRKPEKPKTSFSRL
eukprot:COSAG06_NODE_1879_length_8153_cov_4.066178_6_plen_190_part_00